MGFVECVDFGDASVHMQLQPLLFWLCIVPYSASDWPCGTVSALSQTMQLGLLQQQPLIRFKVDLHSHCVVHSSVCPAYDGQHQHSSCMIFQVCWDCEMYLAEWVPLAAT